jgi:TonB family protein
MLLDRLESGYLLFETPKGMLRADLSFRQRLRLLWTFRHFRQLSVPLLNERERALVNALFRDNASAVSPPDRESPVIGVIENFVPTAAIVAQAEKPAEAPAKFSPEFAPVLRQTQPAEEERMPNVEVADPPILASVGLSGTKFALQKRVRRPLDFRFTSSTLSAMVAALAIGMLSLVALRLVLATPASPVHNPASVHWYKAKPNVVSDSALASNRAAVVDNRAALSTPAVTVQSTTVPSATADPFVPMPSRTMARAKTSHHELRAKRATSIAHMPLASQESGIQATRAPLHFVYPAYQDVSVRGRVALTARVEADGTVRSVRVVSGNRVLAAAAVRAVRHWSYRPYVVDGQPVVTETNIVFSFYAEDAVSMTFPPSLPTIQ